MDKFKGHAGMHGRPPFSRRPGKPQERTVLVVTPYGERFDLGFFEGARTYACEPDIAMSLAGIHDPRTRARCTAVFDDMADAEDRTQIGLVAVTQRRILRVLKEHGGARAPRLAVSSPEISIRSFYKPGFEDLVAAVATVDIAYPTRYETLLLCLGSVFSTKRLQDPLLFSAILTARLEDWRDDRLFSLPQAIAYLLSCHGEWRRTAVEWLLPYRSSWLPDYLAEQPEIRAAIRIAGKKIELPSWLRRPHPAIRKPRKNKLFLPPEW